MARELTKKHEEVLRDGAKALAARCLENSPRGECTLVIGGATEDEVEGQTTWADEDVDALIRTALDYGASVKDLSSRIATQTNRPKRSVYSRAIALRAEGEGD